MIKKRTILICCAVVLIGAIYLGISYINAQQTIERQQKTSPEEKQVMSQEEKDALLKQIDSEIVLIQSELELSELEGKNSELATDLKLKQNSSHGDISIALIYLFYSKNAEKKRNGINGNVTKSKMNSTKLIEL